MDVATIETSTRLHAVHWLMWSSRGVQTSGGSFLSLLRPAAESFVWWSIQSAAAGLTQAAARALTAIESKVTISFVAHEISQCASISCSLRWTFSWRCAMAACIQSRILEPNRGTDGSYPTAIYGIYGPLFLLFLVRGRSWDSRRKTTWTWLTSIRSKRWLVATAQEKLDS